MTKFVQLSADSTTVIGEFGAPQNPDIYPGYSAIADNDARYDAWQTKQGTPAQYSAAIATGIQVTSTGTPALNGAYAVDAVTQVQVQAVSLYIQVNAKFPAGQTSLPWPTTRNSVTSPAAWQAIATAAADYVTHLNLWLRTVAAGGTATIPSSSVKIP